MEVQTQLGQFWGHIWRSSKLLKQKLVHIRSDVSKTLVVILSCTSLLLRLLLQLKFRKLLLQNYNLHQLSSNARHVPDLQP